jgi:hypothetical protein
MSIIAISVKESAMQPTSTNSADGILRKLSNDYLETVTRNVGGDGSEQSKAALNCKVLKDSDENLGSGKYWIRPDASLAAVETHCDMVSDNQDGGWTLVYKNSQTSTMSSTGEVNTAALTANNIGSTLSGKLSDDHIKTLCSGQYRVIETDPTGKQVPLNPLFCKFVDISQYGDDKKSGKWCSQSYSPTSDYSVSYGMSTSTSTYGFSTEGNKGAIITQAKYVDSTRTGATLSETGGSGIGACTPNGGCHVQIWCKPKKTLNFAEPVATRSSFALVTQKTNGILPSFMQFMASTQADTGSLSEVTATIQLEAPSQDLYLGGGYKDSIPESTFILSQLRMFKEHVADAKISESYNALKYRFNNSDEITSLKAQCNQPALGSNDDFNEVFRGTGDNVYISSLSMNQPVLASTDYTVFIQAHRKTDAGTFESGPPGPLKKLVTGTAVTPYAPATPIQQSSSAAVIMLLSHPTYMGGAAIASCILQFGKMEGSDNPQMVWTTLYEGMNKTVNLESSSYVKAGRTYRTRSACKNTIVAEYGPYSEVGVASAAKIQGKPPKAPLPPTFGNRAGNSIEVKWAPPADTGNIELVGYVLNYTKTNVKDSPISHRITGKDSFVHDSV